MKDSAALSDSTPEPVLVYWCRDPCAECASVAEHYQGTTVVCDRR
jgi:hypothetical protein